GGRGPPGRPGPPPWCSRRSARLRRRSSRSRAWPGGAADPAPPRPRCPGRGCGNQRVPGVSPEAQGARADSAADELGQLGHELTLAAGADQPLLQRAVVEYHEGRDAHDLVPPGGVGVVVDVELADGDLALLLFGDLLQDGGDHLAGAAPLGPEVDEDGRVRAVDGLVKGAV